MNHSEIRNFIIFFFQFTFGFLGYGEAKTLRFQLIKHLLRFHFSSVIKQKQLCFRSGARVDERVNMSRLFPGKLCAKNQTKPTSASKSENAGKPESTKSKMDGVKRNLSFLNTSVCPPVPPGGFDILGNIMSGMGNNIKKD